MANLHLISAISFEELHTRGASSGVALVMTYNLLVSEKRTFNFNLVLNLDDEADCFLYEKSEKSTIKSSILLLLSMSVVIAIDYTQSHVFDVEG